MKGTFQLVREPVFASEKEKNFCMVAIDRVEKSHAIVWYAFSVVYWVTTIVFAYIYQYDSLTTKILTIGGIVALVLKVGNLFSAKTTRGLQRGQLWGFFLTNILVLLAARVHADHGAHFSLIAFWGLSSSLAFGILSFRNYTHIAAMVFFYSAFAFGIQGYSHSELSFALVAFLSFLISNAQIFAKRFIKIELIRSYRQQSIYTPKQVLQQAIETKSDVSSLFKPELRDCVCICSDWRSFQAYASGVTPGELATALEAYYNLQIQLLDREFIEGNYFIDWIADELFVVGFETPTCNQSQLLNNACRYAIASIDARGSFADKYGAPIGVDFGIASGSTTVGILGPEGNKKATALGQVPGLARRLQTVGKILRGIHGSMDRVVVDPYLLSERQCKFYGFRDVDLPAGHSVKDLSSQSVKVYSKMSLVLQNDSFEHQSGIEQLVA